MQSSIKVKAFYRPFSVAKSDEFIQTFDRKIHPQTSFDSVLDRKDSLSFCLANHNANTKCHEIVHGHEQDFVIFSKGSSKHNFEKLCWSVEMKALITIFIHFVNPSISVQCPFESEKLTTATNRINHSKQIEFHQHWFFLHQNA